MSRPTKPRSINGTELEVFDDNSGYRVELFNNGDNHMFIVPSRGGDKKSQIKRMRALGGWLLRTADYIEKSPVRRIRPRKARP